MLLGVVVLSSCAITRKETDYWTVTDRDVTKGEVNPLDTGATGNNGVIFPSKRTKDIDRYTVQHDSTYDREYPNFLRGGGIETAGLIGSSSSKGLGFGVFGLYGLFSGDQFLKPQNENNLFKGELIRLYPMEYWLRWFGDAPDWTLGWSPFEFLAGDEQTKDQFVSIAANLYLRHRTYIRDKIPYIIFSPFAGVSAFPSLYLNAGAELTIGSIGGLSLRGYAGFAAGKAWLISPLNIATSGTVSSSDVAPTRVFPYVGLGISIMNFINKPSETLKEWKYMVHSAMNVNITEITVTKNNLGLDSSIFQDAYPVQGFQMKLASVQIPLPILNDHFWAGTSLMQWVALGFNGMGVGVLPLRVGYRQYILAEDLMFEPFFEWSYYPSHYINIGGRFKLDTYTTENIGLTFGYISGSPGALIPSALNSDYTQSLLTFGSAYIGVTMYFGDWNKSPETIHALHETEH